MRIERVDDTTVKLFITYSDIEARGFKREDLWTNRKRGEEFFWNMMEEINEEEDFVVEGPLWIQVHAFEKGVEVNNVTIHLTLLFFMNINSLDFNFI